MWAWPAPGGGATPQAAGPPASGGRRSQGGVVYGSEVLSEGGVVSARNASEGVGRGAGAGPEPGRLPLEAGSSGAGPGEWARFPPGAAGEGWARWGGEGGARSRRALGFAPAPASRQLRGSRPR